MTVVDLNRYWKLVKQGVRFGMSSAIATVIDFSIFTFVTRNFFSLFKAEIISAFVGMTVNFFLQKNFVFSLRGSISRAFFLSIVFSLVVMLLGGWLLTFLAKLPLFEQHVLWAKVVTTCAKFGVNFFSKRWIFERKAFSSRMD